MLLLATSAIKLFEKKKRKSKMWSKKWYSKRNISCDAHVLNGFLETDFEDYCLEMIAFVVWGDKVRKLWDSLSELCSSLQKRLESTVLRHALFPVKNADFTKYFRQDDVIQ